MKNKYFIFLGFAILLASNFFTFNQFNKQKKEKETILEEYKSIANRKFKPVIVTRSDYLSLGEEYIANIYLTSINENSLPKVIVCDSLTDEQMSLNSLNKPISYNSDYQTYVYEFIPKGKGEYNWFGAIVNEFAGKTDTLFFSASYFVE